MEACRYNCSNLQSVTPCTCKRRPFPTDVTRRARPWVRPRGGAEWLGVCRGSRHRAGQAPQRGAVPGDGVWVGLMPRRPPLGRECRGDAAPVEVAHRPGLPGHERRGASPSRPGGNGVLRGGSDPAQGWRVAGRSVATALASALHLGCPQPLALTPACCPACGVMSYTMLSGRFESPLTPFGT